MYGELGYLNLIRQIIKSGRKQVGRNGTTYMSIGETLRFSLENDKIPLMTTKKLAWRVCLKELLWFINGDTNNKILKGKATSIGDNIIIPNDINTEATTISITKNGKNSKKPI